MKHQTIYDYLCKSVLKQNEKIAYVIDGKKYSYTQVLNDVNKLINFFYKNNLHNKEIVAFYFDNSYEFLISIIAASFYKLSIMPLNTMLSLSQNEYIINKYKISKVITNLNQNFKNVYQVINICGFSNESSNISENIMKFKNEDYKHEFLITTTSGSTSEPKAIVLTQENKINRAFKTAIIPYGLSENDVIITTTPMYHSLAFRLSLLPIYIGATGVILKKFAPEMWLSTVDREKVTFSILVSNQIVSIVDLIEKNNSLYNLNNLKYLVSSSASFNEEIRKKVLKYFNCEIHEIYGTSETSTATDINLLKFPNKFKSVGYPISGVSIKILDNDKNELKYNNIGEIAIKTDLIFKEYLNMQKETEISFTKDRYFLTGDLGYIDEDGFLYFKGRKKFIYKVGAINVYPEDIEKVLLEFEGIKECCVVGIPENSFLGTKLVAYFTSNEKIDLPELRKFCLKRLSTYQVPFKFIKLDELPKNHVGKIDRKNLEKIALEDN
ncbi:class I adenylate-forming enzyme family protein [Calditerrivibrio nitroreducens]|uniref:AMP-dependent synthetase and ligase n=1 Tax=Calditerrivibrio nitroreducens (strain DSM 19672 / NBRC 101217 / Yu37-1) TaxID=768670 RepID=E4TGE6_CALNY|nr:class I adenylate-forming enzyme family protein [Calditerrivibrio nitroreducens]ADR18627.1 AMP-dependent synthetase and ligase [Calditerrivibrio nitroreducens DSM 19672]